MSKYTTTNTIRRYRTLKPHPGLALAKDLANKAKAATGLSFEQIGNAIGRRLQTAARLFDRRDQRYHLRYGDLLELAKKTATRVLVVALLEPINRSLKGEAPE